jgi:putative signal transducing protein
MRESNLVVVHTFGTGAEADMAKSALEGSGIDAMIQADSAGGMRPHLAWSSGGFKVLVREEDAAAARDVLEPSRHSQDEHGR